MGLAYADSLKGQCHEIFRFLFFSWISFPQAPDFTVRAVPNFFENSRKSSQVKVHNRCHGGKFAAGINDTGGRFATGINNTSETGGKSCLRCRWYRWQFATGVADTGGNLPPVSLTPVVHLEKRISPRIFEFSKKFETVLMGYSGAVGKLTHEKNQKQKISWHCPFKT